MKHELLTNEFMLQFRITAFLQSVRPSAVDGMVSESNGETAAKTSGHDMLHLYLFKVLSVY